MKYTMTCRIVAISPVVQLGAWNTPSCYIEAIESNSLASRKETRLRFDVYGEDRVPLALALEEYIGRDRDADITFYPTGITVHRPDGSTVLRTCLRFVRWTPSGEQPADAETDAEAVDIDAI